MATISEHLKEIFPTKWYLIFFITYVLLYIFQAILIRLSKTVAHDGYDYNTKSAVLFTEVIKLALASGCYLKEHTFVSLYRELRTNCHLILLYFIPSILYCIYNNLTYVNLSHYDPTTYYILLQLRIAVTGVVYQILFQKYLNKLQWISLLLLTLGCMTKQLENIQISPALGSSTSIFNQFFFLIIVQIFCSCFAGVYNEYLLKNKSNDTHLMIQNICMYLDSIVCNFLVITSSGDKPIIEQIFDSNLVKNYIVVIILFNNALCGLSTSYFIKTFNSIMKAYAAGIELLLTALMSWLFFSIPVNVFTLLSILIVSYATYLYARSPVTAVKDIQPQKLSKPSNV